MVSLIYFGDILKLGETVTGPDGRNIVVAVNHMFHLWYSVSLDLSSKSPCKRIIDCARTHVLLLETNCRSKVPRLLYPKEKEYESAQKKGERSKNTEAATSRGKLSIPESAPLVYLALNAAAAASTDVDQQHPKFTSYRAHISDYLDRRHEVKFGEVNLNKPLAYLLEKPFAPNYADPKHHTYHHSPIYMVISAP